MTSHYQDIIERKNIMYVADVTEAHSEHSWNKEGRFIHNSVETL